MLLETNRLKIIPLTIGQFKLLLSGMEKLERELVLTPSNYILEERTCEAMECQYNLAAGNPDNHLWHTNWQIVLKSENKAVASFCFKNAPDEAGLIEIGYGTNPGYQNKGIMTEAVKLLSDWAFCHMSVISVIAETYRNNIPSQRVLQKNGMAIYKETEESLWWKLEKQMTVDYVIRQETEKDFSEIYALIKTAFETATVKDGDEQDFADNLRKGSRYISQLALVAEVEGKLIGHIMLTKTYVMQSDGTEYEGLLIAPVSVLLEYRNVGVGSALIRKGMEQGKELGYKAVFLCGDPAYYHRFGFVPTSNYGIKYIHDVPEQYIMACELEKGALDNVFGSIDCQ
ncbi:putative N-acetyltransferase YhbS [Dysgonomonas hofstadii]|uniref:Putative N-acetyltransferase YhbS n=1 Tax=Dysgonomonas hofstadii TaxID=637886 RepID=A0A840CWS0_9BACT|nr:GNAT family N-acetyltransferase [Dysgonomonas hofstadii]MBB4036902.1 putative N-acetyltransferase YhbS [Dysgonomonas hofstadii]